MWTASDAISRISVSIMRKCHFATSLLRSWKLTELDLVVAGASRTLDGESYTIVGVMASDFSLPKVKYDPDRI
jgi:hypothetical protein